VLLADSFEWRASYEKNKLKTFSFSYKAREPKCRVISEPKIRVSLGSPEQQNENLRKKISREKLCFHLVCVCGWLAMEFITINLSICFLDDKECWFFLLKKMRTLRAAIATLQSFSVNFSFLKKCLFFFISYNNA